MTTIQDDKDPLRHTLAKKKAGDAFARYIQAEIELTGGASPHWTSMMRSGWRAAS